MMVEFLMLSPVLTVSNKAKGHLKVLLKGLIKKRVSNLKAHCDIMKVYYSS